jgi:HPt (histidine-containing phosphotransfer) domain-containing protein
VESLLRRCRGKATLVESLLAKFQAGIDAQLGELRLALERADHAAVARVAHTIKGASGNLSADAVSAAAGALERLGGDADGEAAAEGLRQLESRVRECLDFVPAAASAAKQRATPVNS